MLLIGWGYLIAGLMTVDGLLLALWLMDMDWPRRWKKVARLWKKIARH
jgi:hypothetical protein